MTKSERSAYYASREWAIRREAVRRRSCGWCEHCHSAKMTSVHHMTYENFMNERIDELAAVCDECHEFLSGKRDRPHTISPEGIMRDKYLSENRPSVLWKHGEKYASSIPAFYRNGNPEWVNAFDKMLTMLGLEDIFEADEYCNACGRLNGRAFFNQRTNTWILCELCKKGK